MRPSFHHLLRVRSTPRLATLRHARLLPLQQSRLCGSCAPQDLNPTKPSTPPKPSKSTAAAANAPPDHRTIATAQNLLINHPSSPGSPLFLPAGTHIYNKLISFLRAQYAVYGFREVLTPNIYKQSLWETSGHWENYKDDMFEVSGRGEAGVKDGDDMVAYGLKPMNCPGHCLMFKAAGHSRKLSDMPVRYADFSPLHRNENSGSLSGLTRVRRFCQDDGHIFCRPMQVKEEILSTLEFIKKTYRVFGLPEPELVLSTRPENYIGELEEWNRAEADLKAALDGSRQPWTLNEGDGAFYGPKIDVILTDSDGKRHQTATVQLDFQLGKRFELEYTAPAPELEKRGQTTEDAELLKTSGPVTPVIIHRAVMGSLERFMALLAEHYNGRWPFWLSPTQARVIPVTTKSERVVEYAKKVQRVLSGAEAEQGGMLPLSRRTFGVELDLAPESMKKKTVSATKAGYNFLVYVGERNVDAGTVSVTKRKEAGEAESSSVEMTPEEAYEMFRKLEDQYQ